MKKLPDERTLHELLVLARDAEKKARELSQMGEKFAQKWQSRLENRTATDREASKFESK